MNKQNKNHLSSNKNKKKTKRTNCKRTGTNHHDMVVIKDMLTSRSKRPIKIDWGVFSTIRFHQCVQTTRPVANRLYVQSKSQPTQKKTELRRRGSFSFRFRFVCVSFRFVSFAFRLCFTLLRFISFRFVSFRWCLENELTYTNMHRQRVLFWAGSQGERVPLLVIKGSL